MDFEKLEKLDEVLSGRINGEIVEEVITKLTAAGENYMSLVLKVDLKVKNSSTNHVEILHAVAKLVPPGFVKSGRLDLPQMTFKNELVWYRDIVPIFKELEEEHDVVGLFTDIYPHFFGGRLSLDSKRDTVDKDAVVILEFLEGYEIADRYLGFDYSTTKEILKALARLHVLPVALKLQKPELFKEKILQCFDNIPEPAKQPDLEPTKDVVDIVKGFPECQQFIHRCEEALKHDPFARGENPPREPWATMVHHDFWVNNIMLKKGSDDQNKSTIKIVDYQVVRYASVARDLMFFFLLSVQPEVLKQHFDELLKLYYDAFIAYLRQLKVHDTEQFKYEDILKELALGCKNGGFSHIMMFTNIVFKENAAGPDNVFDHHPDSFKNLMTNKTQKQKERIRDITKFCAEKNWI